MNNYNGFKIKKLPKIENEKHGKIIKKEFISKEVKKEDNIYIVIEKYKVTYEDDTTSIDIVKTRYNEEEYEKL